MITLLQLFIPCLILFHQAGASDDYSITILDLIGAEKAELCQNVSLSCVVLPVNSFVSWKFNGDNLTDSRITVNETILSDTLTSVLTIQCVDLHDEGNFTCHATHMENPEIETERRHELRVILNGEVYHAQDVRENLGKNAALMCQMKSYPIQNIEWHIVKSGLKELLLQNKRVSVENETHVTTWLNFTNLNHHDNGTYLCAATGPNGIFNRTVHLFVLNRPHVKIEMVKAVGARMLYINWTVNDGNSPIQRYLIQYLKEGTNNWLYSKDMVAGGNSSFLLKNLDVNTSYKIRLRAKNAINESNVDEYSEAVSTLSEDPMFIPEVKLKGTTYNSLTIGWLPPPYELKEYVHYYQLQLTSNDTKREAIQPVSERMNDYLFMDLIAATKYKFKMSACSEYTKTCGNWSAESEGVTMDGTSDPPENVSVHCRFDNISRASFVSVTWQPPIHTYGKIIYYNVELEGMASYRNEKAINETTTWGPKNRRVSENATSARFDMVPANTNYTIRVAAVTRSRKTKKDAAAFCTMPPTIPDKDKINRFHWWKVQSESGRWLFKLNLDRISERNGEICCYMIYLVKLKPGQRTSDLPSPDEMPVGTYDDAHRNVSGGAYIAETFDSSTLESEVFLGDDRTTSFIESPCFKCAVVNNKKKEAPTTELALAEIPGLILGGSTAASGASSSEEYVENTTWIIEELIERNFRSAVTEEPIDPVAAYDGPLDIYSNYTGFVQVVVYGENGQLIPAYSSYFTTMFPGPSVLESSFNSVELTIAIHVLIGLSVVVVLLLIVLFVLHNYTKNVAEEQGIEMTFTNTLMHLCRNVAGRHEPLSSSPPDIPPIGREELVAAAAERHKDSDYGYQREFEMLPDRFHDRTTRASEMRENFYKNRYPDIKAYDQTRVKLAQVDGILGSDYINANFVIGYKERKKFICAQGPMENTVNDFWRMVWEQRLEMILMLTNLEEYSKTKCAKYWPDYSAGDKRFGDYIVSHVQEKRFSDYIVRELKLSVKSEEDGQEKEKSEERRITQYHFLVWKDFQAPDHPSSILKFIKRMNEDYSLEKGPILIHCSAGVGRTGTLVALDSLVQQLAEENQVAIFNTVCDLRHQRNFLVQSLKQYIFVYRCLVEVAQSGDTELKVATLKSTVERLRKKENGKDKSRLQEEFEKLELIVDDKGKTCSVGSNEENKSKNRTTDVIPFDRNRVMLAPIPGKEHSTYINASFIEGYDNRESFIIAQDPLPATLTDFWRMISEQCISTLVMMSDLGEGSKKCMRYWPEPDDECTYDNIRVKYIQSESCPYYTRRELCVTNIKTDDSIMTTQFQYNGWPTVEGEVPEVTRGLIELVDQTQFHQGMTTAESTSPGPIAVHCNQGADRSSIFVALSILIQQLKNEKSVDIFSVVRKLRSQRHMMVKTLSQYEFLHRAVVNYADLHHMCENGTLSPV